MTQPRDAATEAQVRAARPDATTWVAANAGSGKTRVLTDRVARLLLRGTDPQRILCLTFTKAAAGEMQNRLFRRLGEWAMLEDGALRTELGKLDEGAQAISAAHLARARTLFARALETPGGLKIQTIHSFCEALLRRFPLEAGVSPQFEVLEERQGAQLRAGILERLADDPASGFADLAPHVLAADVEPDGLLTDILSLRDRFGLDPDGAELGRVFGLDRPAPDPLAVLDAATLATLISVLDEKGGKVEKTCCLALIAQRDGLPGAIEQMQAAFLTATGAPRKLKATKAVEAALPQTGDLLAALAEGLLAHLDHGKAVAAHAKARALIRFGRVFLDAYEAAKLELGVLEFDDLIRGADALLSRAEAAEWVKYKLDGGIDHVLVDEAQDTSPEQWRVIDALVAEFFAGLSARNEARTLFVVGDEKQSIYSFQGADPRAFGAQATRYRGQLADVAQALEECDLLHSFRSAPPVLALVDKVFESRSQAEGGGGTRHIPFHGDMPGRVELWPFVTRDDAPDDAEWWQPIDRPLPSDPPQVLAARIAARLRDMLDRGAMLPLKGGAARPVSAGDVLILVRSRGTLFHAILKALKDARIPVAGADRLKVMAHLAVRDLLSLLKAVATEGDDLSLAEALRSPLMGVSEAGLYRLAKDRRGTLAEALEQAGEDHPLAVAVWRDLRRQADFLRPYEMLERVLIRHGAAARIRARMGAEGEEAVAAFLQLALDYERVEPPSLTGFIDWLSSADPEIKRQLDPASGEVRVMTIHGAKGLEAPIVILPDTAPPRGNRGRSMLRPLGARAVALAGTAADRPRALAQVEEQAAALAQEERWRLLYVALTRAESWLIVAGAGDKEGDPETSWYAAIRDAMAALGPVEAADGVQVLSSDWPELPAQRPRDAAPAARQPLPDWVLERPEAPPAPELALAPSREGAAAKDAAVRAASEATQEAAMLRGTRLHLLLEHLPGRDPATRDALARRLLCEGDEPATPEEAAALLAEAAALVDDPALAWIFADHGLGEVALAGRVDALGGRIVRGQIDRLLPGAEEVWAIDFKSDAFVPTTADEIPEAYAVQMALYRAALGQIYPGRPVRIALLWTRARRLIEVPLARMDAALATLGGH
ncbi:double-strand break repair helicase AddA [Halovulum dunhuangense]|uniref:DNA 3'-5' helicase n=1 Tax=Halovulum dunhuangense TaxID=1505036 RepID=A0A849KVS5_9RHOB|nr:double-strand break repair helicase AddA [Halovulum dunhuangense]NNU79215.1 double-strand break repair helicase AddA [Halovulum dunhuangense]